MDGYTKYASKQKEVVDKAGKRFVEKGSMGWGGWVAKHNNLDMARRANAKLNALALHLSEDPVKDAADVMNFAIFFAAQASEDKPHEQR